MFVIANVVITTDTPTYSQFGAEVFADMVGPELFVRQVPSQGDRWEYSPAIVFSKTGRTVAA